MAFTVNSHMKMLEVIQLGGYIFTKAEDYKPSKYGKQAIIAHDVDFDIDVACIFSAFEIEFPATFFIQVSSGFYNVYSEENRKSVRNIAKRHSIGLHFDPFVYIKNYDYAFRSVFFPHWKAVIQKERDMLSEIAGVRVKIMNWHRIGIINEIKHHHEDDFFEEFNNPLIDFFFGKQFSKLDFFSDSHGVWKYGKPTYESANASSKDMKIITHPFWYGIDTPSTLINLKDAVEFKLNKLRRDINEHIIGI